MTECKKKSSKYKQIAVGAKHGILPLQWGRSRQTCQALPQRPNFNRISQWSACSVNGYGGDLPRACSSGRERRAHKCSLAQAVGCSQATGAAILFAERGSATRLPQLHCSR